MGQKVLGQTWSGSDSADGLTQASAHPDQAHPGQADPGQARPGQADPGQAQARWPRCRGAAGRRAGLDIMTCLTASCACAGLLRPAVLPRERAWAEHVRAARRPRPVASAGHAEEEADEATSARARPGPPRPRQALSGQPRRWTAPASAAERACTEAWPGSAWPG